MRGFRSDGSGGPVVRVHPETGERALYVSPGFTEYIVGLKPRESQQLLELLWEQLIRPEHTVRFKWEDDCITAFETARIEWLFDIERARQKLGRVYPQPLGSTIAEGVAETPLCAFIRLYPPREVHCSCQLDNGSAVSRETLESDKYRLYLGQVYYWLGRSEEAKKSFR